MEDGNLRRRTTPWREIAALTWDLGGSGTATLAVCISGTPGSRNCLRPTGGTSTQTLGFSAATVGGAADQRRDDEAAQEQRTEVMA